MDISNYRHSQRGYFMKSTLIAAAAISLFAASAAYANPAANTAAQAQQTVAKQQMVQASTGTTQLKSENDKLSYTIGADLGANFKRQGVNINAEVLAQGIKDVLSGKQPALTKEQMTSALKNFQQKMMAKRLEQMKNASAKNMKEGEMFLTQNKAKQGVKTLPSGLQYKILTPGTGPQPTAKDSVTVDYTGTLINGTVFDSTAKAGKPVTFKVTEVIPGWTEALQMMKQGATWQIFVPSKLAYGNRGVGGPIGPNQTLIFKIHLIAVNKAGTAKKS